MTVQRAGALRWLLMSTITPAVPETGSIGCWILVHSPCCMSNFVLSWRCTSFPRIILLLSLLFYIYFYFFRSTIIQCFNLVRLCMATCSVCSSHFSWGDCSNRHSSLVTSLPTSLLRNRHDMALQAGKLLGGA